ncbi:hypothetical protein NDU88_005044 [Pleurodeles waltl]|uniref:Uncharacterized protein n=1 Tax=Pleurodeles waltl TaxID=8319 RepID=A0AAV7L3N1_PLEWA|nr:hypothetical protein NDU88_005044 [Pleurodeles waltl]
MGAVRLFGYDSGISKPGHRRHVRQYNGKVSMNLLRFLEEHVNPPLPPSEIRTYQNRNWRAIPGVMKRIACEFQPKVRPTGKT